MSPARRLEQTFRGWLVSSILECVLEARVLSQALRLLFLPRSWWLHLQTFWVDCTGFLPGSPVFAAFFEMGPMRQSIARGQENDADSSPFPTGEKDHRQDKSTKNFGPLVPEMKDFSGAGSDTSASSG